MEAASSIRQARTLAPVGSPNQATPANPKKDLPLDPRLTHNKGSAQEGSPDPKSGFLADLETALSGPY